MRDNISVIGAALGWGARWPDTELGPEALKAAGILKTLNLPEIQIITSKISACLGEKRDYSERLALIQDFCSRLANLVEKEVKSKKIPLVVGGDHAIAIGTWQGLKSGLGLKKLGLLWVDAHLDAHTPETSPSHNIHGMPLAVLLGFGESVLTDLKSTIPTLSPEHIAMVGIRSAEPGEVALLQSLGVRIFSMSEIEVRGLDDVMQEAKEIVTAETDGFGISVDMDGFDPKFAPGTGTTEPNGLNPETMLPLLIALGQHPLFCGLEIAEFNPVKDHDGITLNLVEQLLRIIQ